MCFAPKIMFSDFYPRSPRGERRQCLACRKAHAQFLSTLPARGATAAACAPSWAVRISIHAPREGSDVRMQDWEGIEAISIHAPREGSDRRCLAQMPGWAQFLSTLPARGATSRQQHGRHVEQISIHAPREGSDILRELQEIHDIIFLSTLPARGATS